MQWNCRGAENGTFSYPNRVMSVIAILQQLCPEQPEALDGGKGAGDGSCLIFENGNRRPLSSYFKVISRVRMLATVRAFCTRLSITCCSQGVEKFAVYAAAKAYVLRFGEALHRELKRDGVTVTVLCPGMSDTGFATAAQQKITPALGVSRNSIYPNSINSSVGSSSTKHFASI